MGKMTLVLGASANGERYSNLAVKSLVAHGHPVIAVGRREGAIGDQPILTAVPEGSAIDTVTLYLSRHNQAPWERRILDLFPARIIFNPGAENPDLSTAAEARGIQVLEACTLVMLSTAQY